MPAGSLHVFLGGLHVYWEVHACWGVLACLMHASCCKSACMLGGLASMAGSACMYGGMGGWGGLHVCGQALHVCWGRLACMLTTQSQRNVAGLGLYNPKPYYCMSPLALHRHSLAFQSGSVALRDCMSSTACHHLALVWQCFSLSILQC